MAEYDLPAMVKYMLANSDHDQIYYVGHSMGALLGLVALSTDFDLARKVTFQLRYHPVVRLIFVTR